MSQFLRADILVGGRRAITWDAISAAADVEILAKVRCTDIETGASGSGTGVALRVSTEAITGLYFTIGSASFRISRVTEGSGGDIQAESFSAASDTWYWIRAQAIENVVRGKAWADGDAEPGTWLATSTQTLVQDAGLVGFYPGWLTPPGASDLAYFSVALDGETAPGPS